MKNTGPDLTIFDRSAIHDARKGVLLQVAGHQFTEKGFHNTSLESIAKLLKLTKAGLYHYVQNKEELLYLCYKDAIESAEQCMEQAEQLDCKAPEKIAAYIKNHITKFNQPTGYFIILSEFYSLSPEHQEELKERAKLVDHHMNKLVEEGIKEGSINACDASLVVLAIQGALNWIPKWYSSDGKYDIDKIADSFIEFFNKGLLTR
ncbi:MAG: TetR/AcrR family transcriptional regulator [Emcibacter sp.]|nr:TetR/AcrR family transcriptional regulator [Emcibacter sp.]